MGMQIERCLQSLIGPHHPDSLPAHDIGLLVPTTGCGSIGEGGLMRLGAFLRNLRRIIDFLWSPWIGGMQQHAHAQRIGTFLITF